MQIFNAKYPDLKKGPDSISRIKTTPQKNTHSEKRGGGRTFFLIKQKAGGRQESSGTLPEGAKWTPCQSPTRDPTGGGYSPYPRGTFFPDL